MSNVHFKDIDDTNEFKVRNIKLRSGQENLLKP